MNHIYRVVWNVASGTWVAVPETARTSGPRGISNRAKLLLAALLVTALPGHGQAQSVVVNADSGNTRAYVAGNGATVVDIDAANRAGLSHNRYQAFHIDAKGLVLNNAATAQGAHASQLAGQVAGNTNLTESAKVILNEVVSTNRSTLAGFAEVLGARADVIVANPYGVTCSGCGFINTDSVTLTTGTPYLNADRSLGGFRVEQGDIAVQGAGLDASQPRMLDLLARSVRLDGAVRARDLAIMTGAHRHDRTRRDVADTLVGSGAAPKLALDSTLLGGMYADRIRVVATEAGTGVRMLGEAAASADDFRLDAAGRILMKGRITARRDTDIETRDALTNAGSIEGGNTVSIRARELTNERDIVSGGNIDIVAPVVRNQSTAAAQRNWLKGGVATETHGDAYDDGGSGGNKDFFQDYRSTWSETRVFAPGVQPQAPRIRAANTLTLTFQDGLNLGGTLSAGNAVILRGQAADGSALFRNEGIAEETRRYTSLSTKTRKIIGPLFGVEKYGWSDCSMASGSAYDAGCRYHGPQTTYVSEFRSTLPATIEADTVRADRLRMFNDGAHAGAATITARYARLDVTALDNAGGRIEGSRSLDIASRGHIDNRSGEIEGNRVELSTANGDITNETLVSNNGTGQFRISQFGRTGMIGARGGLTLDAGGRILNRGATLHAGEDMRLGARQAVLFDAVETHDATSTPTRQPAAGPGVTWQTGGKTSVIQHRAQLSVGGDLRVSTDDAAIFGATDAKIGGNATLRAAQTLGFVAGTDTTGTWRDSDTGGFGVNSSLYGKTKTGSNRAERRNVATVFVADGNLDAQSGGQLMVRASRLEAGKQGKVAARHVRVIAGEDVDDIHGADARNNVLQVYATGRSWRERDGTARAEGAAGLKLYGADEQWNTFREVRAVPAAIKAGGDLQIRTAGEFRLEGSAVEARGNLDARARDVVVEATRDIADSGDTTSTEAVGWMASGAVSASAEGAASVGGGRRAGDDNWATLRGRAQASLEAGVDVFQDKQSKRVTHATSYRGAALGAAGDVRVSAEKAIGVRASMIAAGRDMMLSARDIETTAADRAQDEQRASSGITLGSYLSLSVGAQAGIGATANGAQPGGLPSVSAYGEGGARLSFMREDAVDRNANASISRLVAGRDLDRRAGDRLRDVGTRIDAGGDVSQHAATIVGEAAMDTQERTGNRKNDAARVGAYGSASAGAPSAVAGQGSSTLATGAGAGAGVTVGYRHDAVNEREGNGKAIVGIIKAGGNVVSQSTGLTRLEGTSIQAGKSIGIGAETLEYVAARASSNASGSDLGAGGDVKVDLVNMGGSVSGDYQSNHLHRSGTTWTPGMVEAGGSVRIHAKADTRFEGTQIQAQDSVLLMAARDFAFDPAVTSSDGRSNSTAANGSLGGGAGWGSASGGANVGNTGQRAKQVAAGVITARGGEIGVLAGRDATVVATTFDAGGDVVLWAKQDLTLKGAQASQSYESSSRGGDVSVGVVNKSAGLGSGGAFVGDREQAREHEVGSEIKSQGEITLVSERDMVLAGLTTHAPAYRYAAGGKLSETALRHDVVRERNLDVVVPPMVAPARSRGPGARPSGMRGLTLSLEADGTSSAPSTGATGYGKRVVVQLDTDPVIESAARNLAAKHAGTVLLKVGEDGKLGATQPAAPSSGDVKVSLVGHGDQDTGRLGGKTADDIAGYVAAAGGLGVVKKVALVGCGSDCMRGETAKALAAKDLHPAVVGYPEAVKVLDTGRKVPASSGDPGALGGIRNIEVANESQRDEFTAIFKDMAKRQSLKAAKKRMGEEVEKTEGFMQYGMERAARESGQKLDKVGRTEVVAYTRSSAAHNFPFTVESANPAVALADPNVKRLSAALDKLPNATEVTYRGVAGDTKPWIEKLRPGDTVVSPRFMSTSTSLHVAKAFTDSAQPAIFRVMGRTGTNISGLSLFRGKEGQAEVLFKPMSVFEVQAIATDGSRTYVAVTERTDGTAAQARDIFTGRPVDLGAPGLARADKPGYDARVVVQLDDDAVTGQAARNLADKHPDTRLLQAGADGMLVSARPSDAPTGNIKISLVGHGDKDAGRLGGMTADGIAGYVAAAAGDGVVKKVSLVGCGSNCVREGVAQTLGRQGIDAQVVGYESAIRIGQDGSKAAITRSDPDALGRDRASTSLTSTPAEDHADILAAMARDVPASKRKGAAMAVHEKAVGFMTYGTEAAGAATGLSDSDREVIKNYTRSSTIYNVAFNDALKKNVLGPIRMEQPDALRAALAKLPDATEVAYRGVNLPGKIFGTKVQPGDIVVSQPFMSTSVSLQRAKDFADKGDKDHPTVFRVLGRHGKNIAGLSRYQGERGEAEIVFQPGTQFKVQAFRKIGGRTYVMLREHTGAPDVPVKSIYTGEAIP